MPKFRFYDLEIWKRSVEYAQEIYRITRSFPEEERYGLISQLRRASISISSNIAEGSSRSSDIDFARFIEIAYGSLMESVSQLCVSLKLGFVARQDFEVGTSLADELARMLSGLRKSLRS
jgi:four helix bundle protein